LKKRVTIKCSSFFVH